VQERIAQLSEIGREEGRPEPVAGRPRIVLAAAVFLAVFAGMLIVFMRM
jgi:hypothetical protein